MIVTRIQLYCGDSECVSRFGGSDWKNQAHLRTRNFYPEDGAVDGAIIGVTELRRMAYENAGWRRAHRDGAMIDLCPSCWEKHLRQGKYAI